MTKQIRGSGGAPKRPPAPVREPDTLDSRQFATIQDLVSEGEIEGFPSAKAYTRDTTNYDNAALKDIYFETYSSNADSFFPYFNLTNYGCINFNNPESIFFDDFGHTSSK